MCPSTSNTHLRLLWAVSAQRHSKRYSNGLYWCGILEELPVKPKWGAGTRSCYQTQLVMGWEGFFAQDNSPAAARYRHRQSCERKLLDAEKWHRLTAHQRRQLQGGGCKMSPVCYQTPTGRWTGLVGNYEQWCQLTTLQLTWSPVEMQQAKKPKQETPPHLDNELIYIEHLQNYTSCVCWSYRRWKKKSNYYLI